MPKESRLPVSCDGSCSGADPNNRERTLAFADPPAGWRPRPPEKKPFVCDYDVPALEGGPEPARVNALYYPAPFAELRAKVLGHWKRDDGAPLAADDVREETLDASGVPVRVLDVTGTYGHKHVAAKPEHRLVLAQVEPATGGWSVWLLGPRASVARHRASYLDWVRSVQVIELVR